MVGSLGMAGSLISYAPSNTASSPPARWPSCRTNRGARPSKDLLEEARRSVRVLLEDHQHLVEALRDALLENDELIDDQITEVLVSAPVPKTR